MIACGSGEDHVYIYNMDTGATSSLLLNQYKGESTIIWCTRFIAPTKHVSFVLSNPKNCHR